MGWQDFVEEAVLDDLLVIAQIVVVVEIGEGDALGFEAQRPPARRLAGEDLVEDGVEIGAVGNPIAIGREARISEKIGSLDMMPRQPVNLDFEEG